MKKITLLFSVILLTSTLSYAQDTASYKATLNKMMEASGARTIYKTTINQFITMFKQQKPQVPVVYWDEMEASVTKHATEDLLDMLLPIYQKHLTEDDLKDMIVFYQSPTGKKFAAKTPLITQESMQAGQEWGKKLGEELVKKLKEKGL